MPIAARLLILLMAARSEISTARSLSAHQRGKNSVSTGLSFFGHSSICPAAKMERTRHLLMLLAKVGTF